MDFACRLDPPHGRLKQFLARLDDALAPLFARPPTRHASRILVIRNDRMGDMIVTIPLLAALRKKHPEARLDVLASEIGAQALQQRASLVDEVIVAGGSFDYRADDHPLARVRSALGDATQVLRLAARLRRRRYDLVIDVVGRRRHALLAWLTGAGHRAGFATSGGSFLWNSRVPLTTDTHYALQMVRMVEPSATMADVQAYFGDAQVPGEHTAGSVAIHPGHGAVASRAWPVESWASLAQSLAERGWQDVAVLAGPDEAPLAGAVVAQAGSPRVRVVSTAHLDDLVAVLGQRALFVGAESGVAHLAALLGCRVVALFAASDPVLWAPLGQTRVVRQLEGGRCFRANTCLAADCIKAISVAQVLAAIETPWSSAPRP